MPDGQALRCAVLGTDTGVGKSEIMSLLCEGLRAAGRRVWLHKPVACGDWADGQAEDGRTLMPLISDGQDPATACPWQFPLTAAPNVAAAAAGATVTTAQMVGALRALVPGDHDLLYEGAGGVLAPLSSERGTIIDILQQVPMPVVVVTRPHLGTINHSALTVAHLRASGVQILGLVVNEHEIVDHNDPAISSARAELEASCRLPILAWVPHGIAGAERAALAATVVAGLLSGEVLS